MAYAYVTEFDSGDDRSTMNYDALVKRVLGDSQPDGLVHHSAGFDDNGVFRTYEVWRDKEERERFIKEKLEPAMAEGLADPTRSDPPHREYGYELHFTSQ